MSELNSLKIKLKEALEECQKLDQQISENIDAYRKLTINSAEDTNKRIVCLLHDKHPDIYYELLDLLED